jgi:hypothetical protein
MKENEIFIAATGNSLARAEKVLDRWEVKHSLQGVKINCIVKDPQNPKTIYLGTQHHGVMVSRDQGQNWKTMGMKDLPVKALTIDPQNSKRIFLGSKPVSLFLTENGGLSWSELDAVRKTRQWWWFSPGDPPGMTPYVNCVSVSPTNANVILIGIEAGAVMRSVDGGKAWSKHLRGSDRDCHSLKFHQTNGDWVYEGGGVSGHAYSSDGGKTWQKSKKGLGTKYGWMVAADPEKPDIWYLSASNQPNLFKDGFSPPAHQDGQANGHLYRKIGNEPWQQLSGGLPEPLDFMAYALATDPAHPGHLYAGLANGDVWFTQDYGNSWVKLLLNLGGIHHSMVVI